MINNLTVILHTMKLVDINEKQIFNLYYFHLTYITQIDVILSWSGTFVSCWRLHGHLYMTPWLYGFNLLNLVLRVNMYYTNIVGINEETYPRILDETRTITKCD